MCEYGLFGILEFGDDAGSKHFSEFNTPLVKRVDIPDGALDEDFMLVERDQSAQNFWREFLGQDGICRMVAFESAMWNLKRRNTISRDFFGGLSECQRFGLGEEVGHQEIVVGSDRVQGLAESDEVAGNQFGTLVNELVEGVLAVGTRLSPDNGSGLIVYHPPFQVNMFSIALHIELL